MGTHLIRLTEADHLRRGDRGSGWGRTDCGGFPLVTYHAHSSFHQPPLAPPPPEAPPPNPPNPPPPPPNPPPPQLPPIHGPPHQNPPRRQRLPEPRNLEPRELSRPNPAMASMTIRGR